MLFSTLHRLLGVLPGPITNDMVDAAVAVGIAETDDLDWKSELPPTKALVDSDFPKDIAAMANSGGGVIVYGVEEVQKHAAARIDCGPLDETHERALRAVAWSAISPPVFGLEIHRVGEPGNRAVAIVIPHSVDGPHLIYRNHFFGAPIRNDADTAWMKEREIEAQYRARFDDRRQTNSDLRELYAEATVNWFDSDRATLIAVARPRVLSNGAIRPTRETARGTAVEAERLGLAFAPHGIHPLASVARNLRPGLRRWNAINAQTGEKTRWKAANAALHHDGTVSLGFAVGGHRAPDGRYADGDRIDSAAIECAVADLMALIRVVSREVGTTEYEVLVGVEWRGPRALVIHTVDQSGHRYDGTSIPLLRYSPVSATVAADASDADYRQRVFEIAEDCINQGGISNVRMIVTSDPT